MKTINETTYTLTNIQKDMDIAVALGMAIGALETIKIAPYDFNTDGLALIIKRLRETYEKIYGEPMPNKAGDADE